MFPKQLKEPSAFWVENKMPKTKDQHLKIMAEKEALKAIAYHRSFPQYQVTPLHSLKAMAKFLGVDSIYVKDESYRFGLNAFKVLGGSYAIGRYIAEHTGMDIGDLPYKKLVSKELREEVGQATFSSATDGNHGRGVAWAANKLGQRCVIHMPKGTTKTRLRNIRKLGAEATIEELNYDDCVRLANKEANEDEFGIMVQDTAWEGYEKIPAWIMQGYGTLSVEADRQMLADGCECPTHIFVQAGVGSLAGSVVGYFANKYKKNPPKFIVVETNAADCLYQSAVNGTGELLSVDGDLKTIMAGLACGEGNTLAWDILRNHADFFVSAPDWMSANAMRIYGVPLEDDPEIISGESGAITMGILFAACHRRKYRDLKAELGLDENSRVLLISTEGNTDPYRFREIVWDGLYGVLSEPGTPILTATH